MWFNKIRESMLSMTSSTKKSVTSSIVDLDFDKELPKLNFDYRLNLGLFSIDKLISEIFTDLRSEGFIADYHM